MTQLIIISGYMALLLVLGMFASRMFLGTKSDYLLASRSIGPFLLLMSIFGTTMTAFALVGSSGEAFRAGIGVYGLMASSSGIVHSLCFFLVGIKLWQFGHDYGYTTQIGFFRDRLNSDALGLLLFPILVGLVIPYLLIGVLASGAVIETMTAGAFLEQFPDTRGGVPRAIGSAVVCAVVLCYVFFGGMRGTAWANAFQTIVFMVLGVVTFCVIAFRLGQEDTLLANMRKLGEAIPPERATRIEMSKTEFASYLLIPLSVGMFPHLFQHWLTARSAGSFKLPVVAHPLFIMIVWVPCVLVGTWATTGLVDVPPAVQENPNRILPFLVASQAGPVLGGFLTAGILAAIMSSLDSQFLCVGTIFSNDIMGHYIGRDRFTDWQQVLLARGFIVAIVVITYLVSLGEPPSVFAMGVWTFTGFSSLFPLVFAAVYWRRLTKWGAIAGVLAMIIAWAYYFRESGYGQNHEFVVSIAGYTVLPVVPVFIVSLVVTVVVSLITPPPPRETLQKFFPDA